ncbi:MAG: hypothetical protein IPM06_21015 [Rhizobiales bacterium]|nr:hypothetical protein [Hyphomicrobiales bacterium]
MILLVGALDTLQLVTSSAANIHSFASFADHASGVIRPDNQKTLIAAAGTTTIISAPSGPDVQRTVRFLSIRNTHATDANTITLQIHDGAACSIHKLTLSAGEALVYDEANGWQYFSAFGLPVHAQSVGGSVPAANALNVIVLSADVINNNAVADTIADVTGLGFAVTAGETYWFEAVVNFTSAATTTGSRWTVNGPAINKLAYWSQYSLTTTTSTLGNYTAFQLPAASNASAANTTGNIALVGGLFTPSASGTLQLQFASAVASSAITAKAGSTLRWMRVI